MNKINEFINYSNIILPQIKIYLYGCKRVLIEDWKYSCLVRPYWRFYWNPEQGAEVSDKNKIYYLDKSFILIIPPGVRAKQVIVKPCMSWFVHAGIDETSSVEHLLTVPISESIENILKRLGNKEKSKSYIVGEFLFAVISQLAPEVWQSKIRDQRIEKICNLLKKQPEQTWPNRELAHTACLSENAFIRLFRKKTGLPPQSFLQGLRLEKASSLLLESELSIEEIATICGFCDRHYLTKMFKKHFGQSPGHFRISANSP